MHVDPAVLEQAARFIAEQPDYTTPEELKAHLKLGSFNETWAYLLELHRAKRVSLFQPDIMSPLEISTTEENATATPLCPSCRVQPGDAHSENCEIARCELSGQLRHKCGELHTYKGRVYGTHEGPCGDDVWTGQWPRY